LNTWTKHGNNAKLGIIDFRFLLSNIGESNSTVEKPFFEEFMNVFSSHNEPTLTDLPCWVFIYGDKSDYLQVEAFAKKSPFTSLYELMPSKYVLAPNERLSGHAAKIKLATEAI